VRADPLAALTVARQHAIAQDIAARNLTLVEAEIDKLDRWADDRKLALEREIKDLDRQIRDARKTAKAALTLDAKLAGQREIKALESRRSQQRRALFDAQDDVDAQRGQLIDAIEAKLTHGQTLDSLFTIRWSLV